jgi:hypothetical protein
MMTTHRSPKPQQPNSDVPDGFVPGTLPVEPDRPDDGPDEGPDEGPIPGHIPVDPEHERVIDPALNPAQRTQRHEEHAR